MPLETGTYIADLVRTYPTGTDPKSQGDDHLRLIKTALQNTLPNATQAYDLNAFLTAATVATVPINSTQLVIARSPGEVAAGIIPTVTQWPVGDFRRYGADPALDSKLAIQAAVDVAIAQGGGRVGGAPGAVYPVSGSIKLGGLVDFDLGGGRIDCTANNVPIILVDKAALNSGWKIRNGTLRFVTQQTLTDTNGVCIRLGTTGRASRDYQLEDLVLTRCCAGVDLPQLTGSTAANGSHRNVLVTSCAGWAFDLLGDTVGTRGGMEFEGCVAREAAGSEQAGSTLARLRRLTDMRIQSLGGERLRGGAREGEFLELVDCTGVIETLTFDSCAVTLSALIGATVLAINSRLTIGLLRQNACSVTLTGTGSWGVLRAITGSKIDATLIDDLATTVTDTSTGAYWTIIPEGGSKVRNTGYTKSGTTPTEAILETGGNAEYFVETFAGNVRSMRTGTRLRMFGTAPPTAGTYAVGDRLTNTAQSITSPVTEWVCTVAGTPGTWRQCGHLVVRQTARPTLLSVDVGVMMMSTATDPDGEPHWWNGAAWVNSTGTVIP